MSRGWDPRGARCRGALACLEILEAEGRAVEVRQVGVLHIVPVDGLTEDDKVRLLDLKLELLAWLALPRATWPTVQRLDPNVDLEGLHRYREALEAWTSFTAEEQGNLLPLAPTFADLLSLAQLKQGSQGTVIPAERTARREIPDSGTQALA